MASPAAFSPSLAPPGTTRPSWVVLRHRLPVVSDDRKAQEDEIMGRASKQPFSSGGDDLYDASWILRATTLDAHLVDAPEISTLFMRLSVDEMKANIEGSVNYAEKNILVMHLSVRKALGRLEFFLIYEATKNSLSLVPHAGNSRPVEPNGFPIYKERQHPLHFLCRPVVLPLEDGAYVLADLAFAKRSSSGVLPKSGVLFMWQSSSSSTENKWVRKEAQFHPQMLPPRRRRQLVGSVVDCSWFIGHTSFTFKDMAFWVDLRLGIVVSDLLSASSHDDSAELRFVNLPTDCPPWTLGINDLPKNHRAMACVGDSVRFVALVDTDGCTLEKDTPPDNIVVWSWTLSQDQRNWCRDHDMTLPLACLFVSRSFTGANLPRCVPTRPVLKADEDGILSLLFGDYYVNKHGSMRSRGEHVITVDMFKKTVVAYSRLPLNTGSDIPVRWAQPPSTGLIPAMPMICGAMFSSYITQPKVLPSKKKPGFQASKRKRNGKKKLKGV